MIKELGALQEVRVPIVEYYSDGWRRDYSRGGPVDPTLFFEGFCPVCRVELGPCTEYADPLGLYDGKGDGEPVKDTPWCKQCGFHWRGWVTTVGAIVEKYDAG